MLPMSKLFLQVLYKSRLCNENHKNVFGLCTLIPHLNFISLQHCTTSRSFHTAMSTENKLFQGKQDRFKGVTVDSTSENYHDIEQFPKTLEVSLEHWKQNGNRGIWFKVHLEHAGWVPVLAKNGFKFHHAQDEYVMMYLWIPNEEQCNIPQYAHTMMGVGAVVVNDNSQVLVVREKHYPVDRPHWKLPGGYVEPGENLVDAAIREVYEETNISTEFQSVLTLRHTHAGMFGCSDVYTVVSLRPLSDNIEKCDREIEECQWMDIEEYLNHSHVHELNRFFVQKYLEYKKSNVRINCYHGVHQIIGKPYTVYSVTNGDVVTETNELKNKGLGDS